MQQNAKRVADIVGAELGKAFGAIAATRRPQISVGISMRCGAACLAPMTVSVAEIARSVPFWLFFACELKKQVEELQVHGITKYCFTGRKECVMALQGRKRWDRSCQTLLEDLDFLLSRYEEQEADR